MLNQKTSSTVSDAGRLRASSTNRVYRVFQNGGELNVN